MSTTMELQLNENVKGYIRIPYTAFKTPLLGNGSRSMRRAELSLFGYISSFATATEACNMPYRRFEEKLRLLDKASRQDSARIKEIVAEIVPTYHYTK